MKKQELRSPMMSLMRRVLMRMRNQQRERRRRRRTLGGMNLTQQ